MPLTDDDRKLITTAVQDGMIRALAIWTLIGAVILLIGYVIERS